MGMINFSVPVKTATCKCGRIHTFSSSYTCPVCSRFGDVQPTKIMIGNEEFDSVEEAVEYREEELIDIDIENHNPY